MLTFIGIHPEYQNQGIGKYMLNYCICNTLKRLNADRLYLYALANNLGAQRFYEKNGFIRNAYYSEYTLI